MTDPEQNTTCIYPALLPDRPVCGEPATHRTLALPIYPEPLPLCEEHAATYPPEQVEPLPTGALTS